VRKTLFLVSLVSSLSSISQAQQSPIDRLSWLAGCWELRAPDRVTMEMWMPPMGGTMLGASRTVIGTVTREFEQLRISTRGDTLVYTAIPSGQKETDFKTTATSAVPIAFENLAHDFPQRIIYRQAGPDSVIARVEGPGANNTTRGQNFPMRRASCTAIPAPPPRPDTVTLDADVSPNGRELLVVKGLSGNWDVYAMNADLSNIRQLTNHSAVDYQPTWSPDGRRVAFVSVREGHQEIYTMNPDGSGLVQLTNGTAHNSEPSWSPDGRMIAFRSERDERRQHVYIMNADGTNQRALTRDSLTGAAPAWSPDGRQIAFSAFRGGRVQIYIMNADGSAQTALTNVTQGAASVPVWSPDGKRIAYTSTVDGNPEVYVMNADGSSPQNLSKHPAQDAVVSWSRDGAYLYFRSTRDRAANDIYRMRPDGTGVTRVTVTK
jgi:Tol biopolymer transport system component